MQAVAQLAAAIGGGRAQAAGLVLLALARPPAHYAHLASLTAVSLTLLDGFSDAHGWGSLRPAAAGSSGGRSVPGSAHTVVPLPGLLAAPDGPQTLQQRLHGALAAAAGLRQCLVVDSLSPLLDAWGPAAVARLLHGLQAAPAVSCLLAGVHADLHPPAALAALEQLAAGSLGLQPKRELERSVCRAAQGAEPQGRLELRLRRPTGRVRAEACLYCIDAAGAVAFLDPPTDLLNAQAAAGRAAAVASAPGALVVVVHGQQRVPGCGAAPSAVSVLVLVLGLPSEQELPAHPPALSVLPLLALGRRCRRRARRRGPAGGAAGGRHAAGAERR